MLLSASGRRTCTGNSGTGTVVVAIFMICFLLPNRVGARPLLWYQPDSSTHGQRYIGPNEGTFGLTVVAVGPGFPTCVAKDLRLSARFHGIDRGLGAASKAEFQQDRRHVVLDGLLCDVELAGNLAVGHSFCHVVEDRSFQVGQ
jgi:hypothetical protein